MSRRTRNSVYDTTEADAKAEAKRLKYLANDHRRDKEQSKKREREADGEPEPVRINTSKVIYFTEEMRLRYQAIRQKTSKEEKALPQEFSCSPIKFKYFYCNAEAQRTGGKVHSQRCRHVQDSCNNLTLEPVGVARGDFFGEDCCGLCFRPECRASSLKGGAS